METDDELRRRVELLHAHLVLDAVEASEAVQLACDLLGSGSTGPATTALAVESTVTLSTAEAEELVRDMLAELDHPEPEPHRAAKTIAVDLCDRMLDGTLLVEPGSFRLVGALAQADAENAVARLMPLLNRLTSDLRGHADETLSREFLLLARDVKASFTL